MSAVTCQPPPFGPLEREKHIQGIFRAFKNRCGPSCECQTQVEDTESRQVLPEVESKKHSSDLRPHGGIRETCMQPPPPKTPEEVEQDLNDEAGLQFLSVLETVRQIHVTARPDIRGPQCVSRKIYSITTGSSKSQMFVAVEESSCMCLHFCGPARACSLQGFDYQGQQVFYFERPLRVDACCLGCCLMEMRAYSPKKHLIGTVCQRWSMFTPLLEVCGPQLASRIQIQGPCCPFHCFSDQQYQVEHVYPSPGGLRPTISLQNPNSGPLLPLPLLLRPTISANLPGWGGLLPPPDPSPAGEDDCKNETVEPDCSISAFHENINEERWSMFTPLLEVCGPQLASRIQIQGPCCPFRCFSDQQFQIVSNIGEQIGTIWKKWPGFSNECNTDHEYFGLEVPQSLEPHTKLLLLAATFLLNHMFFEMS